ncbi:MAG: S24/S26 family peptidase [archaeon]
MIYDKNQFAFNVILSLLLFAMIGTVVFFGLSFNSMKDEIKGINSNISMIEKKIDLPNFIQGHHASITYHLSPTGFIVGGADDYGKLSGSSMQPSIFDGNTLIEVKYVNQTLLPGQIIRFTDQKGVAVIHRIRAVYEDTAYVQGDNLAEGEIVSKSAITHIVQGVIFT